MMLKQMDTTNDKIEVTHRYTILYDSETELSEVNLVDSFDDEIEEVDDYELIMSEIKKNFTFVKDSVNIGNLKQGDKFTVIYPFEGDPDLIQKAKPGCSCTAEVNVDKVNKQITAVFNSSKEKPGGFSKAIIVYFKDGKDLEVTTSMGVKTLNPKKAQISLTFHGTIIE